MVVGCVWEGCGWLWVVFGRSVDGCGGGGVDGCGLCLGGVLMVVVGG